MPLSSPAPPAAAAALASAEPPEQAYARRQRAAQELAAVLLGRAQRIGTLRLLCFGGVALCLIAAGERWPHGVPPAAMLGLAAVCLAGFFALVVRHQRVLDQHDRAHQRAVVNQRGSERLDGTWTRHEPRAPHPAPDTPLPPYAGDLDLCGDASLWQLCDCTHTERGQAALLRALSQAATGATTPAAQAALLQQQAAVRELALLLDLRQSLEVEGRLLEGVGRKGARRPDPTSFLRWAEGPAALTGRWPWLRLTPALPLVGAVLGGLAWGAGALGLSQISGGLWLGAGAVWAAQAALLALTADTVKQMLESVGATVGRAAAYAEMLTVLVEAPLQTPANQELQAVLKDGGGGAAPAAQMRRLQELYSYLQLRQNPLLWLPINVLCLWDVLFALRLERWQREVGPRVRRWLEALGAFEARASLATLAHDNPGWAWPELTEVPEVQAADLGHPLLSAARRVGNDVLLPGPGRAWLVTGSNMSGKSTLLRSIGLLQVLAQAGAPVCAAAARLCPLPLRTVMRIDDNLSQGVSHFYAELRRLKEALDAAAPGGPPLLYLLDEILHGTNTRERELGARAVVAALCRRGALGAVSTHDLSLASLEQDTDGAVTNVHFTETVDAGEAQMSFDYRLRPGPVQTTNALRLMRQCGIPLDWERLPL